MRWCGDVFDEAILKMVKDFLNGFVKLSAMRIRTPIILVITVALSFGFRLQPVRARSGCR